MNLFFNEYLRSNTNFNEYLNKYKIKIMTGEDIQNEVLNKNEDQKLIYVSDLIKQLRSVCFNINIQYIDTTLENCLSDIITGSNPRFDIIVLIGKQLSVPKSIIGFMIVELGECSTQTHKNIPVLNLLCKKGNIKSSEIPIARILVYTYVYMMYQYKYDHGLLELGNHYVNVAGLCTYYKFGFREDISLKSHDCFPDGLTNAYKVTIPMYLNLLDTGITDATIFDVLSKNINVKLINSMNNYNEPICNSSRQLQPKILKQRKQNLNLILDLYRSYLEGIVNIDYLLQILNHNGIIYETNITIQEVIRLLQKHSIEGQYIYIPRNTRGSAIKTKKYCSKRKSTHKSKRKTKKKKL